MSPAGRRSGEVVSKLSSAKTKTNKTSKRRSALQGGGNRRVVVPQFYRLLKFMRFFDPQEMPFLQLRRKSKRKRQEAAELASKDEGCASTCFWRDPDAEFCIICGDDKEKHLEMMCPYNYLCPAAYVPCRARLALWGNYTTTLPHKCPRHKEKEQRELKGLVRVNNLPEWYPTEQLVDLFSRFGPLRMGYVATRSTGACKGYGCVVFQHHEHAEEAVEALNCWDFRDHKLRVDWAYPCLNC
ncbi:hypothetical protein C2845_PM04G22010 [Panicum miliaceum]|uniref:RRM domain-containing protein n=1 Tax=Panicum miliaceum TaxID=4540 RepID=A0A3L6QST6_PANMI|nr:hypothetical protein C2845_PM04G22010 [Panicum miliaceum]